MGFEVVYRWREAGVEPGTYQEEIKEKMVRVGKAYEELPIEAVAAKIMAQLARRSILVVDVEIYEFTKKKISYKETDDGIIIKNKKFKFDDGPMISSSCEDEEEIQKLLENPGLLNQLKTLLGNAVPSQRSETLATSNNAYSAVPAGTRPTMIHNGQRASRYEIYDPEPPVHERARVRGMKFTKGKKYPIFKEKAVGMSVVYSTIDDDGRQVEASAEYFVSPTTGRLSFDGANNDDPNANIDLWGGSGADVYGMPNLR